MKTYNTQQKKLEKVLSLGVISKLNLNEITQKGYVFEGNGSVYEFIPFNNDEFETIAQQTDNVFTLIDAVLYFMSC